MRKVALVTGASRGIGRQIGIDLARNGYKVIINYNKSEESAKNIENILKREGLECEIFKADISKEEDVKKMFEFCIEKYSTIDLLVNNAGISFEGLITDMNEEDWDKIVSINLKSVFLCSKEALRTMISAHKGKIINISSMWGVTGASCEVAYSATKAGVIGFTKALAKEVGPSGINVNAIAPGVIMTDMMSEFTDEDIRVLKEETPIMQLGSPKDISNAVLFLASEKSNFITGQIIGVNGGFVI